MHHTYTPRYARSEKKGSSLTAILAAAASLALLAFMLFSVGNSGTSARSGTAEAGLMDKFDMYMTNRISDALDGVLTIDKVYWLSDEDLVAPVPDHSCYGETDDPASLQWLLDAAADLLDGQEMYFSTDIQIMEGSKVIYYLDETILAIVWKEAVSNSVYTYAEVKIADASQFRRFLAGGEYGSEKQFITTEMAASVNAVVASSGDFYRFRNYGTIVHEGVVRRINSEEVDTCMIDDKGDLHFVYGGQITDMEQAQQYVDENNIRFSLAFGPVLVDNGQRCEPVNYPLGEIDQYFPRSALCQMGELHYIIAVVNSEGPYKFTPTISMFAAQIDKLGCEKAYALDGGQTAVIAMDDQLINSVHFGYQREISDIIYFATAVPNGG